MNTENEEKAPAAPPVAKIVSPKEREKMVPLEYPVEFDGKLWTEIRVRRVTGKEVSDFMDKMKAGDFEALPPMVDCPQEVWNALDDDDQLNVDQQAQAFTPRRLKAAVELLSGDGEATSP